MPENKHLGTQPGTVATCCKPNSGTGVGWMDIKKVGDCWFSSGDKGTHRISMRDRKQWVFLSLFKLVEHKPRRH